MKEKKLVREEINFPGNSDKAETQTRETPERERPAPVAGGRIVKRKKTLGARFSETFFGDDSSSVVDYIIHDILVPALKSTVSEMVSGGTEMLLFGNRKNQRDVKRDGPRSYVSYSSYYGNKREQTGRARPLMSRGRSSYGFEDVIFGHREEAESVLSSLVDLTIDYGMASVADFYDLAGVPDAQYTDHKYGWRTLHDAYVERSRDGYIIRLPKALPLDK